MSRASAPEIAKSVVADEPDAAIAQVTYAGLRASYALIVKDTAPRPQDLPLRALDLILAGTALVVLSPLLVVLAVALRLFQGPPILYRGARVGRAAVVFEMLKFRTLKTGAEPRLGTALGPELVGMTHTEVTPIGRWLRATQLDEMPQLWNVVRGDMSLVGPRPIRPIFVEPLASALPAYWQRLVVRPGITGLAQVRRGYETTMAEKLPHDLEWIADRSVGLYLSIAVATLTRIIRQSLRSAKRPDH